jgi:uncharacterized glyoxalase superfamily protein PhnB
MATLRPFVPAKDFTLSQAFYEALGFASVYRDEQLVIFDHEGAGILLQNYYVKAWADNCMYQLFVDDVDAWWSRTAGLADRFPVATPIPPEDKPWGMRVGILFDPAGVLWQVSSEARNA